MKKIIGRILCKFIKRRTYLINIVRGRKNIYNLNIDDIIPKDGKWHDFTIRFYVKEKRQDILVDGVVIENNPSNK